MVDKLSLFLRSYPASVRVGAGATPVICATPSRVMWRRGNSHMLTPLLAIDAVLSERGVTDFEKLSAVSLMEIGRWLHADALVYGEVVDYEAYYGFLFDAWRVTARIRMVSTVDGHELFSLHRYPIFNQRYPAIDPIDIVISSALNLLDLAGDDNFWHAPRTVGREIIPRLPVAERNVSDFKTEAALYQEWPASDNPRFLTIRQGGGCLEKTD